MSLALALALGSGEEREREMVMGSHSLKSIVSEKTLLLI